jgi:hypothetical protein
MRYKVLYSYHSGYGTPLRKRAAGKMDGKGLAELLTSDNIRVLEAKAIDPPTELLDTFDDDKWKDDWEK